MKKKTIALLLALALVFGGAVGGTIAWLTDKTETVTNTFTTAGIDITLIETKKPDGTEVTGGVTDWSAQLVPGVTYTKNPTVTVKDTTDVDIYLFVKFEETGNTDVLTYTSTLTTANGWTQGKGAIADGGDGIPTNVWYRKVMTSDTTRSWELLSGNTISVKDTVTKSNMPAANATPELTYTAYASQLYKSAGTEFTAKEAWENAQPTTPTT